MKDTPHKSYLITLLITLVFGHFAMAQNMAGDDTKMVITSMALSGDNIFAGTTKGGVYRSTDSGKVWVPVNEGLPQHAYVLGMAAHENVIYAVLLSGRSLYTSADNGVTWTKVQVSNTKHEVNDIAVFKNKVFVATSDGLYESVHGSAWQLVTAVTNKNILSLVANDNCMVAQCYRNINTEYYYTTTDGSDWHFIDDNTVRSDKMEIHGNNFVSIWCNQSMNNDCLEYSLWVLSRNTKKWEPVDMKARHFAFDGDKIYAIKTEVTDKKNKEPEYKRQIFMSDDRGRRWQKADEDKDPFITTDDNMQQKLAELDALKVWEIEKVLDQRRHQKLADERYAAAQAEKLKREQEWDRQRAATSRSSSSSGNSYNSGKQPDYRALSNDRFNATHNSKSYIDSRGSIHIR